MPPTDLADQPSGERVIFWLFWGLAIFTAITLVIFAGNVPRQFWPRVYASLAVDLMIPVIAWQLLKAIAQRRERREARATGAQRQG